MGCKKLTYQYAREDTVENFLFFKKGWSRKKLWRSKMRLERITPIKNHWLMVLLLKVKQIELIMNSHSFYQLFKVVL